ncbi:MAG: N-acetylmuramic acid 6-phosphate etherase [Roseateles asaccharophilus]|uniref:N-acetylmuramic acid 6-phosphate etherase n=1 Tax=Roseateles asaccharophilus TaxID=582607 RepID=A0A4R6NAH3_9BURK|nr:N-acetylmuramic acid 6-phosphate etherase [Roseateles asaccharophilus]MDN3544854.1 N-acetylmuramic acid 6-phosphate etherase [Roseateles asaccharophilus]TDP12759.1 N-acetylmuramic acid 6-phosphate etherase [Roseateles asaccharophilus]
MLKTETPSTAHPDLDLYELPQLISAFVEDQLQAVAAVRAAGPQLAQAVAAALPRIQAGGRLIYAGAGTSGRLCVLDSVELYPTFSWPRERALALIAGGQEAMFVAVEGAEDDQAQGARDVQGVNIGPHDVLLALAASGGTPYVLGALEAARGAGALTIAFANNEGAPVTAAAEIGITLDTGPEVISGSTRLKAGSAQKMALNTFSSSLMVRLGKVYGNLMVDLKASNAKLLRRAVALTMRATGADEAQARAVLERCDFQVKVAVVALRRQVSVEAARQLLDQAQGRVRQALDAG